MAFGTAKGGNTTGPADVAVDTIASEDFQRVKLVDGTEGSTTAITQPLTDTQLRASPPEFILRGDVSGITAEVDVNGALAVTGGVSSGNADSTDPFKIGGHATGLTPADTAENNIVDIWTDLKGRIAVFDGGGSLTVDGTVTANLAAGTNNIGDVDVLTLPNVVIGSGTVTTVSTVSSVTAIANALPAGNNNIGDVDVASLPALVAGTANIGDVDVLTLPNVTQARPSTATLTNVNDTNVSTTLLSSTAGRLGASIHNDSTAILYVKFGTTASATSYTVKLIADAFYELPQPCYTGRIDGIWASDASGAARITELTA